MTLYFDRAGRPISAMQWGLLHQDRDYCSLATTHTHDESGERVMVSTVWLGLDHGLGEGFQIFESMIFGGTHDTDCWRYATEQEALIGHDRILHETLHVPRSWFLV